MTPEKIIELSSILDNCQIMIDKYREGITPKPKPYRRVYHTMNSVGANKFLEMIRENPNHEFICIHYSRGEILIEYLDFNEYNTEDVKNE